MSDLWELMAQRLARSAGMACTSCGLEHPASVLDLVEGKRHWCACSCCEALYAEAVARMKRQRREDCERRNHPGLRCSERSHGGAPVVVDLVEIDIAIAQLEAELTSSGPPALPT